MTVQYSATGNCTLETSKRQLHNISTINRSGWKRKNDLVDYIPEINKTIHQQRKDAMLQLTILN
jgi:hypothetical protein